MALLGCDVPPCAHKAHEGVGRETTATDSRCLMDFMLEIKALETEELVGNMCLLVAKDKKNDNSNTGRA